MPKVKNIVSFKNFFPMEVWPLATFITFGAGYAGVRMFNGLTKNPDMKILPKSRSDSYHYLRQGAYMKSEFINNSESEERH